MRGGRSIFLALLAGLLSACSSGAPTPESADAAGGTAAGSVRARERERIQAQQAAAERERIASAADDRPDGGFDFGRGPLRRKRATPTEETDAGDVPADRTAGRTAPPGADASVAGGSVAGRGIRIVWEALAVEREQVENPRFGRRPLRGVAPDLKIVLVSQNHPAAIGREQGRATTREQDGAQMAVLSEADLQVLVRGLREAGFYRVSRPTGAFEPQFGDEDARGRVTIEVDGVSQTVLSMRGQGTSSATKDVPRIYSEAKQAVAAMRNRTPTLNVLTAGGNKVPTVAPKKRGERWVLTPEEAERILQEKDPAKPPAQPAEGDWLPK